MKTTEERAEALAWRIYEAIAEYYKDYEDDEMLAEYNVAIHPRTNEVQVIPLFGECPEGWNFETMIDCEPETLMGVAKRHLSPFAGYVVPED